MNMMSINIELIRKGKVRDIYSYDDNNLLFHTTNRISAFDVILPDEIPGKGKVLNYLSRFWMNTFYNVVPNHLTNIVPPACSFAPPEQLLVVKKLNPIPIEAIVRGYIIGSGWKDYQKTGKISGIILPEGLQLAQKLPSVIFTPSTKGGVGEHDENITVEQVDALIGAKTRKFINHVAVHIYVEAARYALFKGIIIADTKFEFGVDNDGKLHLMDEVLTPDSSRFWDLKEYNIGISPPSYDKQIVRDYLDTVDWDKKYPGPRLPDDIIYKISRKYHSIANKLI